MHLRRVITGLIALPIFLTGILWEYGDWFTAVIVFCCFFAAREELRSMLGVRKSKSLKIWQNILAFLFLLFTVNHNIYSLVALSFLFYWGSCWISIQRSIQNARLEIAAHGLLLIYILFPLACFVYLRSLEYGSTYLFFLLGVACFTDIGAYYGGSMFGKHKLAPVISPKKTWEGSVFGTLLTVLVVLFTAWIQSRYANQTLWLDTPHQYLEVILVTIVMSVVGQIGDLHESAMKRDANIKDSGSPLTGHGGFLDMMDSMLWIGPTMFVYTFLRFVVIH
jgi:phosphatidate cytidylyltransferase